MRCPTCGGSGQIKNPAPPGQGQVPCPTCQGSGAIKPPAVQVPAPAEEP